MIDFALIALTVLFLWRAWPTWPGASGSGFLPVWNAPELDPNKWKHARDEEWGRAGRSGVPVTQTP